MRSIGQEHIKDAVASLKDEGVLLHKADTIWGLICDATSDKAVKSLSTIKGRPEEKSYIILVNNSSMLERYVKEVPEVAWDLIDNAHSPLTIIYPEGQFLAEGVCAADGSVAARVIQDPMTERIIQILKRPIISSSANLSGQKPPMILDDVSGQILDKVNGVISDEGKSNTVSKPSSIIKLGLHGEVSIIRS